MGKLAVKRYISLMFLIIQLVLSIFTFVGLFGGDSNPVGHTASAMLVYILPILIAANAIMLIYKEKAVEILGEEAGVKFNPALYDVLYMIKRQLV